MTTTTRRPVSADVAEAADAAEHNYRAGNQQTAQTHALMAILHFLTDEQPAPKYEIQFRKPTVHSHPMPTEPGMYQDREGIPWYHTKVESETPWMDVSRGHCEDRWFTAQHASQFAPFTRMEVVA
ncbi:hypothetical protein [Curtobacterium sp. MCSS17_006]|uniref:hypothetical protein n=1 Tax=Curtobacterium sp. MCSS17_006 TaxID=2175642 RepID=UPI0011B51C4C|nr:hypothetical protein [Curtobacterium sp. MCSS17_006]